MNQTMMLQLKNLTQEQQQYVLTQYPSKEKKLMAAYILWAFLGVHYLYFNKIGIFLLYMITFGGFGVWAIIDLFRIKSLVESANKQIFTDIVSQAQILYPEKPSDTPIETQ